MKIKTKFFGEINIADEQIIFFPYGIYGFENSSRFVLLHDEEDEEDESSGNEMIFRWLQCIDDENLCFTVMEPSFIETDYNPKLPDNTLKKLGAENEKDVIYLVIAVIYEDIEKSTANLLGPIVVNSKNKAAAQVLLESTEPQNSDYKIKHRIFNNYGHIFEQSQELEQNVQTAQNEQFEQIIQFEISEKGREAVKC